VESEAQSQNREFVEDVLHSGNNPRDIFFNEVPALLAQIGPDLKYLEVNKAYADFFGKSREEILASHVVDVLGEEAFADAAPHLQSALSGRPERYQLHAPHQTGEMRWLDVRYIPMVRDQANIGVSVLVSDVDDLYQYQVSLRQRNRELNRLNAHLLKFSYGLSHDLKSPLTSIAGLIECCQLDLAENDVDEMESNLRRMLNLTSRLVSRIESIHALTFSGSENTEVGRVDLPQLVESVCQSLSAESHLKVSSHFGHTSTLQTVENYLRPVLENLVSNAIKFRKKEESHPQLHFHTWEEDKLLYVSLKDNGIGIPATHLEKLFELFSRMPNHGEQGHGLGLALAKWNMLRLGGDIEVQSDESGTTFTLYLPASPNREALANSR